MPFDWQQFHAQQHPTAAVVDPRRRSRICLAGFLAILLIGFGRTVQLEVTQGAGFRSEAVRPIEKEIALPAPRGRILARDGTILACDRTLQAVAVDYRWLQEPPDARWLRAAARARLAKSDRRNADKLANAEAAVVADRAELARRLAKLCGISADEWTARARRIQARVERIAASANRRQESGATETASTDRSWAGRVRRLLLEDPPSPRIVVAEELAHHIMADDVPAAAVVAEIEAHGDKYPGTKIVELTRRAYPGGTLAAHVLGHMAPVETNELGERSVDQREIAGEVAYLPERWGGSCTATPVAAHLPGDLVGRMGVERQYEAELRGRHGTTVEQTDHSGHVTASIRSREPQAGGDVVLTLDAALQRTAEELLASAQQRRAITPGATEPGGGAIVVADVHNGAILAAASAPTFDPNLFVAAKSDELAALLVDKTHPLFDRVGRMAIPPGSTFKVLTAVALLESAAIGPDEAFFCQGYLHQPDRQRCEIYVRQGVGHGGVNLAEALAVSCNVYFFHFAGQMGPRPLVDWAERLGFGRTTGVDLPGEAAGTLPSPENLPRLQGHAWRTADTQAMAIGQGAITTTPLQMLRLIAAVANGGKLVAPHVRKRGQNYFPANNSSDPFSPAFSPVREGLLRVVAEPKGTAHATVYLESTAIAGKTGTAETGEDRASHAWFVGYAPADNPTVAFVIVLEHAGDAATAAGPLAKRLVVRMEQLGLL